MQSQNDILFGNTHFDEFLSHIRIGGVLLQPDFTVFDIEMENRMVNPIQASPADAH